MKKQAFSTILIIGMLSTAAHAVETPHDGAHAAGEQVHNDVRPDQNAHRAEQAAGHSSGQLSEMKLKVIRVFELMYQSMNDADRRATIAKFEPAITSALESQAKKVRKIGKMENGKVVETNQTTTVDITSILYDAMSTYEQLSPELGGTPPHGVSAAKTAMQKETAQLLVYVTMFMGHRAAEQTDTAIEFLDGASQALKSPESDDAKYMTNLTSFNAKLKDFKKEIDQILASGKWPKMDTVAKDNLDEGQKKRLHECLKRLAGG